MNEINTSVLIAGRDTLPYWIKHKHSHARARARAPTPTHTHKHTHTHTPTYIYALQIQASAVVCSQSQCLHFAGYKKCVLVGHDWGGIVAWSFAQTSPEMVERFIVMNCPSSAAYIKQASSGLSQIRKSW